MHSQKHLLLAATAILMLSTACASKDKSPEQKPQAEQAAAAAQPTQPQPAAETQGLVVVNEAEYLDLTRMPLVLMDEASADFRRNNFGGAASDLEAAARLLSVLAKHAPEGDSKNQITVAANNLNGIVPQIREMQIRNPAQFTPMMADVSSRVGLFHRLRAEQELQANQSKLAGHDMNTAAEYIDRGMQWTGQDPQQTEFTQVRSVASKLTAGSPWSQQEVTQALSQLGASIDRVRENMGSSRMPASPSGQ